MANPDPGKMIPRGLYPDLYPDYQDMQEVQDVSVFFRDGRTYRGTVVATEVDMMSSKMRLEVAVTKENLYTSTKEGVTKMDTSNHHKVTVIRDREHKSAMVYVEVAPEQYLASDGAVITREPGSAMPLWRGIPEEIFIPMLAAGRDEYNH